MPVLPNTRHERFSQELSKGKSQAEAYELAGYRGDRTAASRLATNVNVQARVSELQQRSAVKAEITIDTLRDMLLEDRVMARELSQPSAAIMAVEKLARLYGYMVERKEVGKPGEFDGLTVEQKRERVFGIAKQLGLDRIGPTAGSA